MIVVALHGVVLIVGICVRTVSETLAGATAVILTLFPPVSLFHRGALRTWYLLCAPITIEKCVCNAG